MKKIICYLYCCFSINAFAYHSETIPNSCGLDNNDDMYAVFVPNQYICSNGEFLPANTLGCRTCPTDFVCAGGTFYFNDIENQGLENPDLFVHNLTNSCAANVPLEMVAVFAPNSHTCSAGYYLPANTDGCTICPAGSACVGGTYSFNETADQGIVSCTGTFSPSGSAVCYPHILHVGNDIVYLKSTKQTTPSLNLRIGGDVFYANMTTERTKMNKDSSHYLHVKTADNVHYYVCDDTTYAE